jgi:hypothetical protein
MDKDGIKKKVDDALAEEQKKEKVVDKLIKIAINESSRDQEGTNSQSGGLFHTPASVAYADIPVFGRRETWPVRSRGFKQWLVRVYYEANHTAPNSEAVQSALALMEARGNIDGPERDVFVRVGGVNGKIYIDLANKQWQVIEVDATGWRILDSKAVPVRFRRAPAMLPLPMPVRGGSLEELRRFLNVKSDSDFELAIAWLLAAMRDRGPFPVLALIGEHGTAKSSFMSTLRSLIDPNAAALRSFPREDRDLFIAALNSWFVGYDNVSKLAAWISDALCRLSTGGGFSTRKLYSDDEEAIFNAQRPVILNGIEDFVSRPDLADRAIFLTLEKIPEEKRLADQALQAELERARPQILGALLDRIVIDLGRLPYIKLKRLPRMADFALWATACERTPGAFMAAYDQNRAEAVETVLEADVVATAVRTFMQLRQGQEWTGTATSLLSTLTGQAGEMTRSRGWPSDSALLGGRLRRAAPALRKVGINIQFDREGHQRQRMITIRSTAPAKEVRKMPSAPSAPSSVNNYNGLGNEAHRPQPSAHHPRKPLKNNDADSADSADGVFPTLEGNGNCAPIDDGSNGSQHLNDVARIKHGEAPDPRDCGPMPEGLIRRVPPDRRPALGPEGDSLDDLK